MSALLKDSLFSSIFVLITYLGFIHNVGILQVLIGLLYTMVLIAVLIGIILLYGNFGETLKYKDSLKNSYKPKNLIPSLIVVPVTCWILYTSVSYNFLAIYSIIVALSFIIRYKVYTLLKTK